MSWLKVTDNRDSEPLIVGLCRRPSDLPMVLGSMHLLDMYCARHTTDGFLPEFIVKQKLTRRMLGMFVDPPHGGTALLHRRGDTCPCMKGMTWRDGPWDYYCHEYLRDNPTKEEHDLRQAKISERKDPILQAEVWARDGGCCRYCGERCGKFADNTSGNGAVLDHVDPTKAIGIVNLVLAHKRCNSRKQDKTPEQARMTLLPIPGQAPVDEAAPRATPAATRSATGSATHATTSTRDGTGRDGQPPDLGGGNGDDRTEPLAEPGAGSAADRPPTVTRTPAKPSPYERNRPHPDHHAGWPADNPDHPTRRPGQPPAGPPGARAARRPAQPRGTRPARGAQSSRYTGWPAGARPGVRCSACQQLIDPADVDGIDRRLHAGCELDADRGEPPRPPPG